MLAGAVNHWSPVPEVWMPKSVPLRDIATTSVEPGTSRAASVASLHAGMPRLRKKWSLPATKRTASATSEVGAPESMSSGSSSRRNIKVPARLRLWPSSPICNICAAMALMSTGPWRRTAVCSSGPRTSPIQCSRSTTSGP